MEKKKQPEKIIMLNLINWRKQKNDWKEYQKKQEAELK